MDKKQNFSEGNKDMKKSDNNRKNFLKELAYCPEHIEDEKIKRCYITPDEISDIFSKITDKDEKEPEI